MFDVKILLRASLVGIVLQVAFVFAMAAIPAIPHLIGVATAMFVVMMISGVAGLLYAWDLDKGYSPGAMGGLVVGLVSALVGLALAQGLEATPVFPLGLGTVICTGIGAIGGVFGQMQANIRRAIRKL